MDSRQAERISVSARGSFRRGAGLAQTVTFADLTREGCRLIDIPRSLSRGERISLRIGNVGPIVAQVCWLRLGREAGLAFEQPLSEQVYDLLTTQNRVRMQSAYRAEIMGLHNSFVAEENAVEEPEAPDNVVPIHGVKPDVERRIGERTASDEPAMLIDAAQRAAEVRLVDVSSTGMRIAHDGTLPPVGSMLELVFADHRIARGEVRWAEDGKIGLHVVPVVEESALAGEEPVAEEPDTPTALPDLPKDQLAKFMDLFEAAKLSGFSVVKLRVDADAIEMIVSTDPAR